MSNVIGLKELNDKLMELEFKTSSKAMRSAAVAAIRKTKQEMKAAAPKGRDVHRTYKGRLVAPGFLSRSVKHSSRIGRGKLSVSIGVKREAFYGVTFLDKGTSVKQRRRTVKGRKVTSIRPYRLGASRWFESVFEKNVQQMTMTFRDKLKASIGKLSA